MHKFNILRPLSLARFFLTQQLICKSKIEKQNVISDINVWDNSIARNLHLFGLEEKCFSYIRTHTHLLDQIVVFVLLKIKERSEPYHRDKEKICIDQ